MEVCLFPPCPNLHEMKEVTPVQMPNCVQFLLAGVFKSP